MKRTLASGLALLVFSACGGGDVAEYVEEAAAASPAATAATPAPASALTSGAYIEYTVSGDVDLSAREEEVLLCSVTSDGFMAHTIGNWNITLEADGSEPGTHGVRYTVAAPAEIEAVNVRGTDDRFYGAGSLTIEDGGTDNLGLPAVKVSFRAERLTSRPGYTIDLEGDLFCGIL